MRALNLQSVTTIIISLHTNSTKSGHAPVQSFFQGDGLPLDQVVDAVHEHVDGVQRQMVFVGGRQDFPKWMDQIKTFLAMDN